MTLAPTTIHQPGPANAPWPTHLERRRPGRIPNASPELLALLRNPASREARLRVALYDAPGFVLPDAAPPRTPYHLLKIAIATAGASAAWAVAFKVMLSVWG